MTNEKVSQKSEKLGNNIIWYALLFISLIWVGTGTFFHAASPQFINPLEPFKKSEQSLFQNIFFLAIPHYS